MTNKEQDYHNICNQVGEDGRITGTHTHALNGRGAALSSPFLFGILYYIPHLKSRVYSKAIALGFFAVCLTALSLGV
jgi:hypothetical protein